MGCPPCCSARLPHIAAPPHALQCGQQWLVKLEGHQRATSFNTDVLHAAEAAAAAAVLQPFEPVRLEGALPRGDIGSHVASHMSGNNVELHGAGSTALWRTVLTGERGVGELADEELSTLRRSMLGKGPGTQAGGSCGQAGGG